MATSKLGFNSARYALGFGFLLWAFAANSEPSRKLSYCIDPDWMPYEAIHNLSHVGISADYVKLIEQSTGMTLSLLPTENWQQTLDFLEQGKCQLASMLNLTPERQNYLAFTKPYFESANVFVTYDDIPYIAGYDSIGNRKLGIVKSYRHAEYVKRYYPDIDVTLVDSESDGLKALSNRSIDIFVGSQLSVAAYIQNFARYDLKIVGLAKPYDKLRMAVIKDLEPLIPALNQAIDEIDESQHVEIFRRWNSVQVINTIDYRFVLAVALGFFLVLGLVVWRNYYIEKFNRTLIGKNNLLESLQSQLVEQNKQLEFLSNHDALTGLYNRHYMIKRCEEEIARISRFKSIACLIILDIDYFKRINDQYGHGKGDYALKELAEKVNQQIRDVDVLARWGGEEFLILCPQISKADCYVICQRLSVAIQSLDLADIGRLTCSFGIAQYQQGEAFLSWFERSDKALYQAKNQGRNAIVSL